MNSYKQIMNSLWKRFYLDFWSPRGKRTAFERIFQIRSPFTRINFNPAAPDQLECETHKRKKYKIIFFLNYVASNFYSNNEFRTRGRHRWKFERYPVPILTQKIFLTGTRYPSVPKIFFNFDEYQPVPRYRWVKGYRSCRPLVRTMYIIICI